MIAQTSLVRVWLAPPGSDIPVDRINGIWTVVVRGPFTSAVTAIVETKSWPADKISEGLGLAMPAAFVDEHLSVGPDETDLRLLSASDVIVRRAGPGGPGPWSLPDIRSRFPGCLVAAVMDLDTTCVWAGDQCQPMRFVPPPESTPFGHHQKPMSRRTDADIVCCASVVHAWLVAGRSLVDLDTAHLIVLGDPTTSPRGVQVNLVTWDRCRTNEEAAWQVGC
jgi:hypothetical protein